MKSSNQTALFEYIARHFLVIRTHSTLPIRKYPILALVSHTRSAVVVRCDTRYVERFDIVGYQIYLFESRE